MSIGDEPTTDTGRGVNCYAKQRYAEQRGEVRLKVLDHGYVAFVESWGSDKGIVEAARMSTQKGFLGWGPKADGKPGDEKLLRFLWEHKHSTPFEFAGLTIEVQAPIFVFREWHRHRTQSFTEASARYAPLEALDYIPSVERIMLDGGTNKQAGSVAGSATLTKEKAAQFRKELDAQYHAAQANYESALEAGVPKELARVGLPVGRYSKMRAQTNLRNWLHFLSLRMDANAQWEIRQFANAVGTIVSRRFPRTWELFQEGLAK